MTELRFDIKNKLIAASLAGIVSMGAGIGTSYGYAAHGGAKSSHSYTAADREKLIEDRLGQLKEHYGLDFAANLDKIYRSDTLHRTVEYMRKHY